MWFELMDLLYRPDGLKVSFKTASDYFSHCKLLSETPTWNGLFYFDKMRGRY